MIVQLLGANGAGKSTIVHTILRQWKGALPCYVSGRKRPLYYVCSRGAGIPPLVVLGHYEIANGGCDTIGSVREIKELIRKVRSTIDCDILMEGKTGREPSLVEFKDMAVRPVLLNVSLEKCIASVRERGHKIADHVVASAHEHALRLSATYEANGIDVFWASDRELAKFQVCNLLGVEYD